MIRPKPVESSLISQILLYRTSKQSANPVNSTLKMYQAFAFSLVSPVLWLWSIPPPSCPLAGCKSGPSALLASSPFPSVCPQPGSHSDPILIFSISYWSVVFSLLLLSSSFQGCVIHTLKIVFSKAVACLPWKSVSYLPMALQFPRTYANILSYKAVHDYLLVSL